MRVRLTELGAKGLLLIAALEVAFLATSYSNLFFLLIVFCCVLGVLGLGTAIASVRGVRVTGVELPPGPADAPRTVRVAVRAPRRTFDLAVTLLDGAGGDVALPAIPTAHGAATLALELAPQPRGVRALTAVRVATRFPFGLFEVRVQRPLVAELVTYPAPAAGAVPDRRARGHDDDGDGDARALVTAGLRPFRTGDAVRDVHWKATARRGAPIVKEREREAAAERSVVVDRRGDATALETTLARATAAVLAAAASDRAVRLHSQGFTARVPAGQAAPADVLRWLAAAQPLPADAPAPDAPEVRRA